MLTVGQLVDVEPLTAVVVAGRTATGPPTEAPLSGLTCVGWQVEVQTLVQHSSEWEELVTDSSQGGDLHVYGEGDSRVWITPELAERDLLSGHEAMSRTTVAEPGGGNPREFEKIVDADTEVVVAGVVEVADGMRRLGKHTWVDGTSRAPLDHVLPRLALSERRVRRTLTVFLVIARHHRLTP